MSINPLLPRNDIAFALSNARRFYSSKGDPLGVKGLREIPETRGNYRPIVLQCNKLKKMITFSRLSRDTK